MNTINLEAVAEVNRKLGVTLDERNGTSGEAHQMLLNAVNLGVTAAFVAASSALSIAIDVRAIRAKAEGRA